MNIENYMLLMIMMKIYIYIDVSMYGTGAYLYQLIDGVEYSIQFVLVQQTNIEPGKEAYAIYYALMTLG